MLIIVNITTNRLTASTTSKTCYMLDFNEVFWHADNADKTWITRKTRGKRGKITRKTRKNTWKTRKITQKTADSENFLARTRCGADGGNADAARRGRQFQNADAWRVADADYLPTSSQWFPRAHHNYVLL